MAIYNVGTGSGSLTIDGLKANYKAGDIIKVKAGKYSSFNIKDLIISDGYVNIQNDGGIVEIIGSLTAAYVVCSFKNIRGVNVSGNGTDGVDKGFYFHDNRYRMIDISGMGGVLKNFTMQYCKFENIQDYTLCFSNFTTVYNGTDETISSNLRFYNIEAVNCNLISGAGNLQKMTGLLQGLEVAKCYFHDSPNPGSFVYWSGVNDYSIHDNVLDNINQKNDNHNGIFMLTGNGKFYNNKVTNHQGNAIRAWAITIGTTPKKIEIFNNIVYNSRKYGAFELQVTPDMLKLLAANKSYTYANAEVYNNTAGQLNTLHDWEGLMLDLYTLAGGSVNYYNNLGFNMWGTKEVPANMINNMANNPLTVTNCIYKNTWQEAVKNTITFTSLFAGVGANSTDTKVYYNIQLSKDFTRNNCQSGYTGSSVTYIVPAGKYSSKTSQADADAQAQADITANGQNYANANGTCTSPEKKVTAIIYVYSDGSTEIKIQ